MFKVRLTPKILVIVLLQSPLEELVKLVVGSTAGSLVSRPMKQLRRSKLILEQARATVEL